MFIPGFGEDIFLVSKVKSLTFILISKKFPSSFYDDVAVLPSKYLKPLLNYPQPLLFLLSNLVQNGIAIYGRFVCSARSVFPV